MKAISRQQQLFRSSLPCQPPFAPQQECGTVGLCDLPLCHWRGQPAPAASHFFTRIPAPLPVPGPSPGFCPPACLPDWRVPIGDAAVQLPAGRMKSLFDGSLDGLDSLLSVSRLLSGLITSNTRATLDDDGSLCTILYCFEERLYLYFPRKKKQLYFEIDADTRNYTVTPLTVFTELFWAVDTSSKLLKRVLQSIFSLHNKYVATVFVRIQFWLNMNNGLTVHPWNGS